MSHPTIDAGRAFLGLAPALVDKVSNWANPAREGRTVLLVERTAPDLQIADRSISWNSVR